MSSSRHVELIQFASDDDLAGEAGRDWWLTLSDLGPDERPLTAALSGGRIAAKFFASVVAGHRTVPRVKDRLHLFWADERCVPPDHPESSYGTARELLCGPAALDLRDGQIHRIRGELEPPLAAAAAEADLMQLFQKNTSLPRTDSTPVLDLVILGMGEDGHVASLFPGNDWETDHATPAVYRPVVSPKPPPNRVTLTYRMIRCATEVWVLASGRGKTEALARSLLGTDTPLGRVREGRSRIRIYSDIQ